MLGGQFTYDVENVEFVNATLSLNAKSFIE